MYTTRLSALPLRQHPHTAFLLGCTAYGIPVKQGTITEVGDKAVSLPASYAAGRMIDFRHVNPISWLSTLFFLKSHRKTFKYKVKICKAIPVTGRGGPLGCNTSRLPHFLDNRLTDGGEVVSLTRRPAALYPHEDSWYSFLLEAESTAWP
jgi:hypothetical protein